MTEPLVFPLGHYMGAVHRGRGAPMSYRRVRLGTGVRRLVDDEQLRIWGLAHGLTERVGEVRWTRQALLKVAGGDAERVLDNLIAEGVIAEVAPGTAGAVQFARGHRLLPLLTGLGNSPDDPLRFAIGFPGTPGVVKVDSFVFEMWQWCRLGRDLWETADMFAKAEQEISSGRGINDGPERLLTEILEQLHVLLAHNAAYLDVTLRRPATR